MIVSQITRLDDKIVMQIFIELAKPIFAFPNILLISYVTFRKFLQKLQIAKSYRNPMYALQMSIGVLGIQKTPENHLKYSLQQQFLFLEALQKS